MSSPNKSPPKLQMPKVTTAAMLLQNPMLYVRLVFASILYAISKFIKMFQLKNRQSNSLEMAIECLIDNLKIIKMSEQKLNEWEKKAIEIIQIVNGLSQTQINHIFSLVNHSVIQSPIQIDFQRKSLVYQNADILNGGRLTVRQFFSEEDKVSLVKEANDLLFLRVKENGTI